MSAPGRRSLTGSVSKLSVGVQMDGTYVDRLSLLSPVLGETDAPAPVRAKGVGEGEGNGEGCSKRAVRPGGLEPLTLILSPWPRGDANKGHVNDNRRTLRVYPYCPKVLLAAAPAARYPKNLLRYRYEIA